MAVYLIECQIYIHTYIISKRLKNRQKLSNYASFSSCVVPDFV